MKDPLNRRRDGILVGWESLGQLAMVREEIEVKIAEDIRAEKRFRGWKRRQADTESRVREATLVAGSAGWVL